ncbi:MAG: lipid-A-disaccharide synthase [Pirellulales bacterium]|jgi:lipid-A-disaccharide synthase
MRQPAEARPGSSRLVDRHDRLRVFLSAGEPSGDHHAAALLRSIRHLRPEAEFVGLGGPQLAAAGCTLVADLTSLAVMWFLRVLLNIHRFVDLARRAERSFLDDRPDVLVMVDFPGFHWWLAWRARRHGIPVVFYCPPQIWAWASWRSRKMRRLVDHVLAALPFEQEWFAARGISSTLVGHPFFDELVARQEAADEQTMAPGDVAAPLVLLLPGSRGQEIEANLGTLLTAAERVKARCPQAQPVIGALHARHAAKIQQELNRRHLSFPVEIGKTRQLIGQARVALAVSGSVSLELLAAQVPTVIVYRVSGFAYVVQSWFRHARFITLVNLLAVDEPIGKARGQWLPPRGVKPADPEAIYPEYLCVQDPAEQMAADACRWVEDEAAHRGVVARLKDIAATVSQGESADRAAAAVIEIAEQPVALCHPGLSSTNEQAA